MDFTVASILALDGATNGAIYALLALALVLVFAVTRVIFIPQGEFVTYGALTVAMLQMGRLPGTVWLLLGLAVVAALLEAIDAVRRQLPASRVLGEVARTLLPALVVAAVTWVLAPMKLHLFVQSALALAIVTTLGPLV